MSRSGSYAAYKVDMLSDDMCRKPLFGLLHVLPYGHGS